MTECQDCEYYLPDDDVCGAFECYGIDCPDLPCEKEESRNDDK